MIFSMAASALLLSALSVEARFNPSPAEAEVPALFRLGPARFAVESETVLRTFGYEVDAVRFPSPLVTADPANNVVHAELFRPTGVAASRRPAVVVLHILGADFALSRYLAARLADRGAVALFVKLPYYGERRGPGGDRRFLSADVERSVASMRQGVLDVRRAVAYLAGLPEVDPGRIGVAGISLGGIVGGLAAAVDPAISSAALLLAGGDLGEILWTMPEGAKYRKLWLDAGKTRAELDALTRPLDPLTYAGRLKGKRVLMVAGRVDETIPPSSALKLWEAAGRPPIRWLDCGHYSAGGFLLPEVRNAVEFLAR